MALKPFKFRHVRALSGAYVLVVILLLAAGVMLVGHAQNWFAPQRTLRVQFPAEGLFGIQQGAEVRILQTPVGAVQRIIIVGNGQLEGVLRIRGDFIRFVCADSEAVINKVFSIAGDSYLEITRGHGAPLPEGALLPCRKGTDLSDQLADLMKQLRASLLPLLDETRGTVKEFGALAGDLRSPTGAVQVALQQVSEITAVLNRGEGMAGRVLRDPALAKQLDEAVRKINGALDSVQRVLKDAERASGRLPEMTLQSQQALSEAQDILKGLRRNWLIGGTVEEKPERLPTAVLPLLEK